MIDADSIRELIETYTKHGWILRRVLLTPALGELPGSTETVFGDVPIKDAAIDAAWFSRPPKPGGVAWEIRYLGKIPFALVERIDEDSSDFEDALAQAEERLSDLIASKKRTA
jgi:hypothetical protein